MAISYFKSLVIYDESSGAEFEVFINSENRIFIGNDTTGFTLDEDEWVIFKKFVDNQLSLPKID